jgi:hypothetical protein
VPAEIIHHLKNHIKQSIKLEPLTLELTFIIQQKDQWLTSIDIKISHSSKRKGWNLIFFILFILKKTQLQI